MSVPIIRRKAALRDQVTAWKRAGELVGVVPTMGAVHSGHLSLVEAARAGCDRVVVTIFVNPKQFNNPQDYETYPRTEAEDAVKLAPYGVDVVYVPEPEEIYPEGFATTVSVTGLTEGLCGAYRPGHFDGVTTVVSKLFLQTGADRAFFGEKDYQQLQVVTRMAADLDIPVEVVPCETVREPDGLALSSRNLLLSPGARAAAPALNAALKEMASGLLAGRVLAELRSAAEGRLLAAGFDKLEYLELRAAEGLAVLERPDVPARLLVAAWIGGVRLIDNIAVG